MSRFDTAFAASGLPGLFAYFGQAALYCPVKRPAVSVTGILDPEERRIETHTGARVSLRTRKFTISANPSSEYGGVVEPNEAATVTISNEDWAIDTIDSMPGGWILFLVRPELIEQARPGYRVGSV